MCFDEARREIVMFGNYDSPSPDTWTWTGTNWKQHFPVTSPSNRAEAQMAYDAARQQVVLFGGTQGRDETWVWDGLNWKQLFPLTRPTGRSGGGMAYDPVRQLIILASGNSGFGPQGLGTDTWTWDGTNWFAVSGVGLPQTFDLSARLDGTWNFTRIEIPSGVSVSFAHNRGNSAVRLLASDGVAIDGVIDLSGQAGVAGGLVVPIPQGGPGGFAGGIGGSPSFQGSSPAGGPGQGPGGGGPGINLGEAGQPGQYASSYGNPFIQPLMGGSGGGGSAAHTAAFGNHGGGGGGAIMISSSRDVMITGKILANGGTGFGNSGAGSGGAIRLRADRITIGPSGLLQANNDGRIRLESYERALLGSVEPSDSTHTVVSSIVPDPPGGESGLVIESVAGQNVDQPPRGDLLNPDVTFTADGDITVTVRAQNVPDGTAVKLRVTMTGNVINKPAPAEPNVVLAGGKADFSLTVPKGRGTVQAFAEFNQ
ncbi:MAG: hypothetical protein L0Z50_28895 [Verrucomicrobiales bacterium]|nr:hypothetical protein [Verrucomicrobiales bacterium]